MRTIFFPVGISTMNWPSSTTVPTVRATPSTETNVIAPCWSGWPSSVTCPFTLAVPDPPHPNTPQSIPGNRKPAMTDRIRRESFHATHRQAYALFFMASPRSILEKDLAQREQNFLSLCRSLIEIIATQEDVGGSLHAIQTFLRQRSGMICRRQAANKNSNDGAHQRNLNTCKIPVQFSKTFYNAFSKSLALRHNTIPTLLTFQTTTTERNC